MSPIDLATTTSTQDIEKMKQLGLAVLDIEANAILSLKQRIDNDFIKACYLFLGCTGRIVVMGMGKSGHIARKIAATLASTGSPAFFVHPGEAGHGDMGMITAKDVILAVSNSGETSEILTILPLIKRLNIPFITLTGNPLSTMAKNATVNINVNVPQEACPLGLAPTSSTTAALAMGDALAVALLEVRGFSVEDFAFSHPGGSLGRKLLLRVQDIMHTGDQIPTCYPETTIRDALFEITAKKLGMTTIIDHKKKLLGIFTDGDLRRALDSQANIHTTALETVMTKNSKTILPNMLAVEALNLMETYKITSLVVINQEQYVEGIIHLHDLLRAGVI
jgi:arabinose-5-phosphate isomerase